MVTYFKIKSMLYFPIMFRYAKAASLGCCRAINLLGLLQFHGRGSFAHRRLGSASSCEGDKKLAFLSFCAAAKGGYANAYYNVGNCLEYGIGTERDTAKAISCYREGAALGCKQAMYSLGYLLVREELRKLEGLDPSSPEYFSQHNVFSKNTSLEEGVKYLRQAYELGVVEAGYQLGRVYEISPHHDSKSSLQPYLSAAAKGHAKAAYCAANILYMFADASNNNSMKGESAVYLHKALSLYEQAAEGGIADAMNSMGLILEGEDVFRESKQADLELAARMYFEAAAGSHEEATLNLALLLATGRVSHFTDSKGTRMTLDSALDWLVSNAAIFKEHLVSKYNFALRRIETLINEESAEKSRRRNIPSLPKYSPSPVRIPKQRKPADSQDTQIDASSKAPPRLSLSNYLLTRSPSANELKSASPGARNVVVRNDSITSRSVLSLGARESIASSPYSGLRPLNKQYEALTSASTYVV